MQDSISTVRNAFFKKCQKVIDETSQFEILSLLCKNASISHTQMNKDFPQSLLHTIHEALEVSFTVKEGTEDLSQHVLDKTIHLLIIYYKVKALKSSEFYDPAIDAEVFDAITTFILKFLELQAKEEKYAIFFVKTLKKYFKLFSSRVSDFILSISPYFSISRIVSSLLPPEETAEHDYTTQAALALQKKYQIVFTIYSEAIHALQSTPEALILLEEEYKHLTFLYLWCSGVSKEHSPRAKGDFQIKSNNFIYGAENFLGFYRRNLMSMIAVIYKILAGQQNEEAQVQLLKTTMKLFGENYIYFSEQGTKFIEDELFRPKSLDYIRLMILIYEAWPKKFKGELFQKDSDFFWQCLEKGLLVDDPQAKNIALQLLENIIADEKERIKAAKLPDMKKFITAYDKTWNCFLDLYKTLEQYAVHLVKALFPSIDILVKELEAKTLQELGYLVHNRDDILFYRAKWPLYILLQQAASHKNTSVTRHFIKSFLKLPINIDELQEFVYNDLFKMLNVGMFYRDSDLQVDSRFFKVVSTFFVTYYKKLSPAMLKIHIRKFLTSTKEHIRFITGALALLLVFQDLRTKEIVVEKEELNTLIDIVREHGPFLNLRRQHQMFQSVVILLFFNTNTSQLELEDIVRVIDCFPSELFKMPYQASKTKGLIWDIMSTGDIDPLLNQVSLQDFDFVYKLFIWLFLKFDLKAISDKISTILSKDFEKSASQFAQIVRTLRIISVVYEITEGKDIPLDALVNNQDFIREKVDKRTNNVVLQEALIPFFNNVKTIYKNTYLKTDTSLQMLKVLNSILQTLANQKDHRTSVTMIHLTDQIFPEVTAYIFLLLNKELNSEETPGHTIDETIASIIRHILTIASQSQYLTVKCTLLSHASKLVQDYITLFKSYLSNPDLDVAKLTVLLLLFNAILDCYNKEILYSIHYKKGFFIESEIYNQAVTLLSMIRKVKFTSGFTRIFEDLRSKFMINYFLLISYDKEIVASKDYVDLTRDIIENAQDTIDSHDVRNNAENLFMLLKVLYVPYFLSRFEAASPDEYDMLFREYRAVFDRGIRTLLETDFYTFAQIKTFIEFIFDERILIHPILAARQEIKDLINELLKEAERRYLLLRVFINQFLRVMLKHPESAQHYLQIFKKLIIQKEYRGFEAEVYDKIINEKKDEESDLLPLIPTVASYYGAYTRLYTLIYFEQYVDSLLARGQAALQGDVTEKEKSLISDMKAFVEGFVKLALEHNIKGKISDVVMPYSEPHRKKVHLSQAVCVLMRVITKDVYTKIFSERLGLSTDFLDFVEKIVWKILDFNNLPSVRQYHEIFILHLLRHFPERMVPHLEKYLKQKTNRTQFQVSTTWVAGYHMLSRADDPIADRLFIYFFPHVASNIAYIRAIGQYFAIEFLKKKGSSYTDHPILKEFYDIFINTNEKLNMIKKFADVLATFEEILNNFSLKVLLTTPFDDFGEILHDSVTDKLKSECVEMMAIVKSEDTPPPKKEELWQLYMSLHAQEAAEVLQLPQEETIANFQKKIEIDEELYPNDLLMQTKLQAQPSNEKMDIIVVATLLEKLPNFANLTRTSEIFGVAQLVVPNIKILEDEAFKAVSVTAEKWMNIIEVKEDKLGDYLRYKKMCGYTLIGLEQTRESTSLEKFKFPEKCVMLLGNEREGTPMKYIEMMDQFIEIPQYGKIRSLNVHISAVICIWECVKQKKKLLPQ